ncbi:MAG: HD domain-containing protein [Firmicutes bacterium]|nr:HD domain-containing protein [Bacillota bacterium]
MFEYEESELRQWFLGFPRGDQLWREAVDGAVIAREIARRAGEDEALARLAFLARDVGKVFWPDWLFERRVDDRALLYGHVTVGVRTLEGMPAFAAMPRLLRVVQQHHERWDGRGYPFGLAGPEADRLAHVVAVADAVAAMTRGRPWAPPVSLERAAEVVAAEAGRQFHPDAGAWVRDLVRGPGPIQRAAGRGETLRRLPSQL